jgi:hypothetical protein
LPSHQLSKQRFTRLHDHLRHLYVRPLEAGHDAIRHQQLQLLVVERAQSQDSLEHRQDVSDKPSLILGEHHDTVDAIHCTSSSRDHARPMRRPSKPRPRRFARTDRGGRSIHVRGRLDAASAFFSVGAGESVAFDIVAERGDLLPLVERIMKAASTRAGTVVASCCLAVC